MTVVYSHDRKHKVLIRIAIILLSVLCVLVAYKKRRGIEYRANKFITETKIMHIYGKKEHFDQPRYNGLLTPQKRYLAIGFDDFRLSDFSLVEPLFREYGARATYNIIAYNIKLSKTDAAKINQILSGGNELGDHTWLHQCFVYQDALCNGQDPDHCDGNQIPFPTDEQITSNAGDEKNAFGFDLNQKVCESKDWMNENLVDWSRFDTAWKDLSAEQCQEMRDSFSIYKDKTGFLKKLDKLSNVYCGTSGSSYGSWNDEKQCYTGGIFSGAKTSCNYEIWERILQITDKFYKSEYSPDFKFYTWSWPGSPRSPFVFAKDGKNFYDVDCTVPYNYLARFPLNSNGDSKSWTDLLRKFGYKMTHDTIYPSRFDMGGGTKVISKQLIFNASLSRKDALAYRTNASVSYNDIAFAYPKEFFKEKDSENSFELQMYEDGESFYNCIEALRHDTSNGMVHGEIIDSENTFSEKAFLKGLLEYCRKTGVEVISKKEAFDICFNQVIEEGNLIYNPTFRNTVAEFLPQAINLPRNPDGYRGLCEVEIADSDPVLITEGETYYLHYGIPLGRITWSAEVKGNGNVTIYGIKNSDDVQLLNSELELLGWAEILAEDFSCLSIEFRVSDNAETEYEAICEGLGDKIMGLKIVYSKGLSIKNLQLKKNLEIPVFDQVIKREELLEERIN